MLPDRLARDTCHHVLSASNTLTLQTLLGGTTMPNTHVPGAYCLVAIVGGSSSAAKLYTSTTTGTGLGTLDLMAHSP